MKISKDIKPPVGRAGGCPSIHDWERETSPWHESMFPEGLKEHAPEQGALAEGWMALDGAGNQIGFIADGTEVEAHFKNKEE